mmetsp:Transcript_17267/g.50176  ORF Transcript_17267/g.50176 Transcript_17267/m.50176 type:complete len:820 (-) Transcript_17267:248-2707(-)
MDVQNRAERPREAQDAANREGRSDASHLQRPPSLEPLPLGPRRSSRDGSQPRGASAGASTSITGRMQAETFAEALQAVEVMREVNQDIDVARVTRADELVLSKVEEELHNEYAHSESSSSVIESSVSDSEAIATDDEGPGDRAAKPEPPKPRVDSRGSKGRGSGKYRSTPGASSSSTKKHKMLKRVSAWAFTFAALLNQEARRLALLLPYVIGFVGHGEESLRAEWRIWVLRPLYALVIGRAGVAICYGIVDLAVDVLPMRVTVFIESLQGWPAITIAWLGVTSVFYYVDFVDSEAWLKLRGVDWLVGVNVWIAVGAVTRALVNLVSAGVFSRLQQGHFESRVKSALLSLRVLRILFSTARSARSHAHARQKQLEDARRRASFRSTVASPHREVTVRVPSVDGSATPRPTQSIQAGLADTAMDEQLFADLSGAGDDEMDDQLEVLRSALQAGSGFPESLAESRKRASHTFRSLLFELHFERQMAQHLGHDPIEGVGPPRTIPRDRLVRWCTHATRRRGAHFKRELVGQVLSLFNVEHINEDDFVAAVEHAYKEQRYISASVDSFDQLNRHMHTFAVIVWAVIIGLAGIFLVDVGINFDDWIFPLSSTFLSFSVLLGWLPFDTAAGILFVLWVKPYDIGDRVSITSPGKDGSNLEVMTVAEIGLLSTRFYSWRGELHSIPNFILRRLAVINHTRSRNQTRIINVQLPATTPGERVSELIDVVRNFVDQAPQDWVAVEAADIKQPDYARGTLTITMALRSAHARVRDGPMTQAETRIYMLVHVYLQSIGIEYTTPVQNITVDVQAPNAPRGADDAVVASES